ncbi:MAG: carboxypeptidase-like regulatory domain-containing protein [Cyclobacteriaceae bacterium]|nr:carboxypeptidase-like regulatory domain-containing protein [Cyclobacteriaceae bacterium]
MRNWIFAFCLFFMISNNVLAQESIPPLERIISIDTNDKPVADIIKSIGQAGGFSFSYSAKAFSTKEIRSISIQQKTVREVLEILFQGEVQFKQKKNYVILNRTPDKEIVVSGYVTDDKTGERLKEVSVYDPVSLRSAITDEYGYFQLSIDKAKSKEQLELAVQKNQYESSTIKVSGKKSSFNAISLGIDKEKWRKFTDSVDSKVSRFWRLTQKSIGNINLTNIRDTLHRSWQVSFVPFVGTNHKLSGNVVNDFSLNILGGYSAGTSGAEFGGLFNIDRGDVKYAQFASLFNLNGGTTQGAQFAGLFNVNLGPTKDFQSAGLFNVNLDTTHAVQLAGLINMNASKGKGAQLAGLINTSMKGYDGAQVAGLINFSTKKHSGTQVAGLMNINTGRLYGSQVSGLLNVGNKIKGSQVGIINIADSVSGVPFGLFSFVNKGYHKIEIAADEIMPLHFSFRTGVNKLYNIFTAGVRPSSADTVTWMFGYGLGTAPKITKWLSLNIDATANQLVKGNVEELNLINKIYVGFDFKLTKKLSLTTGLTYNFRIYDTDFTKHATVFDYYTPKILDEGKLGNTTSFQSWLGAKVGIRFL